MMPFISKQLEWNRGLGNSNEILGYEFIDRSPLNGLNYYRLTQYDFDGQSSSSEVIALQSLNLDKSEIVAIDDRLKVYTDQEILGVRLFGFDGRMLKEFIPEKYQSEFDISDIHKGLYIVALKTIQGNVGQKVMVK